MFYAFMLVTTERQCKRCLHGYSMSIQQMSHLKCMKSPDEDIVPNRKHTKLMSLLSVDSSKALFCSIMAFERKST